MRVACYLPRPNHLRVLAPIMDALKAGGGHASYVIPAPPLVSATKDDAWTWSNEVEAQSDGFTVTVDSPSELLGLLVGQRMDVVISVGLALPEPIRTHVVPQTRAAGIRWCAAPYLGEELLQALTGANLDAWDVLTTGSAEVRGMAALIAPTLSRSFAIAQRFVPIGWPSLDPVVMLTAEQAAWRWPYDGQRVLVMPTAARPVFLSRVLQFVYRSRWRLSPSLTYRDLADGIRLFADRHGALLVLKTRAKHRDPAWLSRIADDVLADGDFLGRSVLLLLLRAGAYAGPASGLATEASATGLRQAHLLAYPSARYEHPLWRDVRESIWMHEGPWDGALSRLVRTYTPEGRAMFAAWAEHGIWPERHAPAGPEAQAALHRVAGRLDGKASERLLAAVKAVL